MTPNTVSSRSHSSWTAGSSSSRQTTPPAGSNPERQADHCTRDPTQFEREGDSEAALTTLQELSIETLNMEAELLPAPGTDIPLEDAIEKAEAICRELERIGYHVRDSHRVYLLKKMLTSKQLKDIKMFYPQKYTDLRRFLVARYSRQAYVAEKMALANNGKLFLGIDYYVLVSRVLYFIKILTGPHSTETPNDVIKAVFCSVAEEFPNMMMYLRLYANNIKVSNYKAAIEEIESLIEATHGPGGSILRSLVDRATRKVNYILNSPSVTAAATSSKSKKTSKRSVVK
ncbi:hypothetical protein GQ42DRAFT_164813, partial [Ramicandelaber brevisporus]